MRLSNYVRETAQSLLNKVVREAKKGFNPLKASYGETVELARQHMPELVEVMEEYIKRPYKTIGKTAQDGLCEEITVIRSKLVKAFKAASPEQMADMTSWGTYQHESYLYNLKETEFDMSLLVEKGLESTFRQDYELQKSKVKVREGLFILQYLNAIIAVDTKTAQIYRLKDTYKHHIKEVNFRICKYGKVETEVIVPKKDVEISYLTEAIENYELVDYEWVSLTENEDGTKKGLKYEEGKVYQRVKLSDRTYDPYGKALYINVHNLVAMCEWGYNLIKHTRGFASLLTVDHINGDSLDNRIENLRVLTRVDNTSIADSKDKRAFNWVEFYDRVERDREEATGWGKGHYEMLKGLYSNVV